MQGGLSPLRRRLIIVGAIGVLLVGGTVLAFSLQASPSAPERIQVTKVWSDQVDAPSGNTFFILFVNASNTGGSVWNLDPALFTLATNASSTYQSTANYTALALLRDSAVGQGQRVSGAVAFELPAGQGPSKLIYADSRVGVPIQDADIPAVTAVASRFDPSVHYLLNGTSWAGTIATWAGITNQTSGLAFFGGEDLYRSNAFIFFSGQKIDVTFSFFYYKRPMDPATIQVRSISNGNGFPVTYEMGSNTSHSFVVTNAQHPLPVTMTGYGASAQVTILLTVPPGPQQGPLRFTVQFTG